MEVGAGIGDGGRRWGLRRGGGGRTRYAGVMQVSGGGAGGRRRRRWAAALVLRAGPAVVREARRRLRLGKLSTVPTGKKEGGGGVICTRIKSLRGFLQKKKN